jgi:putative endonuclease
MSSDPCICKVRPWSAQAAQRVRDPPTRRTTTERGARAEQQALAYLQRHGLRLLARNYRLAAGPRVRAGEIDLIMQAGDGTVVFVEVRKRTTAAHGGAAASIGARKRARIVLAARHYLLRWPNLPPCRFDVVALDGPDDDVAMQWLQAAFDVGVT